MPDKKLTDNEIVKALECCRYNDLKKACKKCPFDKEEHCLDAILNSALDLINHLQAKAIKEQNKNSKLRNERNRLQAQNKDLAETVHNLTIEKDALFDKAEELKAEIERLKTNLNVELENFATEYDNKIKSEAYKEFAERLKNEIINDTAYACDITQHSGYYDYQIKIGDIPEYIDNLVKEMVGEDNASKN